MRNLLLIVLTGVYLLAANYSTPLNPSGIREIKEVDEKQLSKKEIQKILDAKFNDPFNLSPKPEIVKNFTYLLSPAQSKIIVLQNHINTAFTSDSKICDYKIINENQLVVYAKDSGYCEIKIFGNEPNKLIAALYITVDRFADKLNKIAKDIEKVNPGSKIMLRKLNPSLDAKNKLKSSFMISGTVPNEQARDNAYNHAALALGLVSKIDKKKRTKTPGTSSNGHSIKEEGDEYLMFLEKIRTDRLIDNLQITLANQVNVKLVVADVEKSIVDKLGFDYNQGVFKLDLLQNQHLGLKSFGLSSILEAIADEKVAKILAKPNLSVLSGESASFQVVSQYTPISTTLNNSGYAVSSVGSPVDYGISLSIQPKIFSKDRIVLHISQEVSNIQSVVSANGASSANLKKRRTSSVVELADGQSFILAGLVDEADTQLDNGISGLKKVPVLGGLFKKVNNERKKSELIILVTVNLANPLENEYAYVPNFEIKSFMEQFFNISNLKNAYANEGLDFFKHTGFIK